MCKSLWQLISELASRIVHQDKNIYRSAPLGSQFQGDPRILQCGAAGLNCVTLGGMEALFSAVLKEEKTLGFFFFLLLPASGRQRCLWTATPPLDANAASGR